MMPTIFYIGFNWSISEVKIITWNYGAHFPLMIPAEYRSVALIIRAMFVVF